MEEKLRELDLLLLNTEFNDGDIDRSDIGTWYLQKTGLTKISDAINEAGYHLLEPPEADEGRLLNPKEVENIHSKLHIANLGKEYCLIPKGVLQAIVDDYWWKEVSAAIAKDQDAKTASIIKAQEQKYEPARLEALGDEEEIKKSSYYCPHCGSTASFQDDIYEEYMGID